MQPKACWSVGRRLGLLESLRTASRATQTAARTGGHEVHPLRHVVGIAQALGGDAGLAGARHGGQVRGQVGLRGGRERERREWRSSAGGGCSRASREPRHAWRAPHKLPGGLSEARAALQRASERSSQHFDTVFCGGVRTWAGSRQVALRLCSTRQAEMHRSSRFRSLKKVPAASAVLLGPRAPPTTRSGPSSLPPSWQPAVFHPCIA